MSLPYLTLFCCFRKLADGGSYEVPLIIWIKIYKTKKVACGQILTSTSEKIN